MKYSKIIKSILLVFFLLPSIVSMSQGLSISKVLNTKYEQHFISSGDNFPEISLKTNGRYLFLVGLHNGFEMNEIQKELGWTDSQLSEELILLKNNGYLKINNGNYFPAINILMQKEGDEIFENCEPIARKIVQSIAGLAPDIKNMFAKMKVSSSYSYDDLSFFLLSDVLLDNWQINNVEREFLQRKRPLRHGKRYYIQYAEVDSTFSREVFGIYGNQYKCDDSVCYITYGNNRKNHPKKLDELANMEIPLLTKEDQEILREMANMYMPELIKILKNNKKQFLDFYEKSIHRNETDFEEFFIWYYHFLYTESTDMLAAKGIITIPETGIYRIKLE